MDSETVPVLEKFFIFNSTFMKREGEEENKILFFYPSKVELEEQIKIVGLCEALVQFTKSFSEKSCEYVHTQKTRQIYYEAAPNFWMVMIVTIPPKKKTVNGKESIEYREDDVQNLVCKAILQQSYDMFKIFMGPIDRILEKTDISGLKQRFDHFFSRYVYSINMDQADIVDVFDGIQFLPLDKTTFLRVQCYVNQIESSFNLVKYTAFMYNDSLVWCALEPEDIRIIYRYLVTSLLPAHPELDSSSVSTRSAHMGRFITGPPNLSDSTNFGKIPKVYLKGKNGLEECYLIVYRALRASICLFLDASSAIPFNFYEALDQVLGPELTQLSDFIYETTSRQSVFGATETHFRYIYYNQMNMALKSTLHADVPRKTSLITVPQVVLRVIADMKRELNNYVRSDHAEMVVKTSSEAWVVAKHSDKREVYIVLTQRNANLIEVHEEAKRLCATQFSNIFFLD